MAAPRKITDENRARIISVFRQRQALPSDKELARECGVSVSAVRSLISYFETAYVTPINERPAKASNCIKCGAPHDRVRTNGVRHSYCLACHAADARKTRKKHSELSPEQKRRANARAYANSNQRRGKLLKQSCCLCGAADAQKHHADYSRPLDVTWLCKKCHVEHHSHENLQNKLAMIAVSKSAVLARMEQCPALERSPTTSASAS